MSKRAPQFLRRAREALSYDPETGVFLWAVNRANKKAGDIAGAVHPTLGYRIIGVDYRKHYAHQLAIAFVTGSFPPKGTHVDHINGDPLDNRIANLRVTTPRINLHNRRGLNRNNTSGFRGVFFCNTKHRWCAEIMVNRRGIRLGYYKTLDEAVAARAAVDISTYE